MVPAELAGAIVSNEYAVLRCSPLLDPEYLKQLIHSVYLQQTFFHSSIGVHIEKMIFKLPEWFKWPINLPPLPEQRKIAGFLGAVDTKIAQLAEKKRLLEDYKKGCMQQIFSQKIRFKDETGNNFPDWEEKRLGEVTTVFSGGTPSSSNRAYYDGDITFIGSGDISSDHVEQFISEAALAASSAKLVNSGDLLYALYGATSGEVAISKISGAINQAVLCIRSTENTRFLFHWLRHSKDNITATYLQGGQGNLSGKIVKALRIPLPHPEEQRKIADFLSALDRKIDLMGQELTHARSFKQGLLQQMFV